MAAAKLLPPRFIKLLMNILKSISGLLLIGSLLLSAAEAGAEYKDGYYNGMNGKKKEALKKAAKQAVTKHTRLEYYSLPEYWEYSDVYPDLVDGQKRWWDMYSDAVYLIRNGQSGRQSFSANKMQREHAVPKSWWKKNGNVEYTPCYSDMWNLYPSDAAANQAKLNYPFGVTQSASFNNGVTKVGTPASGYGGGCANVFEPGDQYKGDFARAIFYVATVYDDINWVYHYMFNQEEYPTLTGWAINMLLQWSRTDPVSQKEIDRNNYVEQYQGNRNPFVDFPELAEYIWGVRQTETFYVDQQQGSDPTPPITGDPEISAPVNGSALDFGQVAAGHAMNRVLQIEGKNLTSPLSLRVSGAGASAFIPEVTSIPASTMNQNGGYLLNIAYMPQAVGKHEARLVLYDGGISGSIAVILSGEALEPPTFSTLHALEAANVAGNSYTARWEGVPTGHIADYYLLTRVRYNGNDQEAETYETGELSYTIADRDPNVAESYSVQYSRLGMLSPASNVIYVAASGIDDLRDSAPMRVLTDEGGFKIVCNPGESGSFRLYDAAGMLLMDVENVAEGEQYYPLPAGVYVISANRCRPIKIMVK